MLPASPVSDTRSGQRTARSRTRFARPQRTLRRLILTAATVAGMLGGLPGCSTLHNGFKAMCNNGTWNESVLMIRNRNFSAKAWYRRKHHFCNEKYIKDFSAGFRAGYEDAANGVDDCTPAFPPKEYWGWQFQSAEGQGRTSAWFAGYPQGVRAAEEDGITHWNQLQMGAGLQALYPQNQTMPPNSAHAVPMEEVLEVPMQGLQGEPTEAVPAEILELREDSSLLPLELR